MSAFGGDPAPLNVGKFCACTTEDKAAAAKAGTVTAAPPAAAYQRQYRRGRRGRDCDDDDDDCDHTRGPGLLLPVAFVVVCLVAVGAVFKLGQAKGAAVGAMPSVVQTQVDADPCGAGHADPCCAFLK